MLKATTQLQRYGLAFVTGVPTQETSAEICELRKLAGMFGEIRNTFYGELWDVRNIRNSRNIAYTNLDLGLHMDLLYVVFAFRNRAGIYLELGTLKIHRDISSYTVYATEFTEEPLYS